MQIPAIQRGVVWKPKQVEFLWDSIFRGFPIGSFILYRPNKETDKLELMDGQQRCNAISLGFKVEEDPKSIVWIDLNPTMGEHSTREFLFRVTTKAHPWGFKNDEDCSRLSSSEIRNALLEFGMNEDTNIYKQELRLTETWLVNANKPVPLFMLMQAGEDTNNFDEFRNKLIDIIKKSRFKIYKEKNITEYLENITYLKKIWHRIKDIISNYRVPCNELPIEVIQDKIENLEIFFTRINKGGTPISNEDLAYASIKAYWPEIRTENDKVARDYMSPAKLAMLSFRLCLMLSEDELAKELKGNLSLAQIRDLSKSKDSKFGESIKQLYNPQHAGSLRNLLGIIDGWLDINDTPESTPKFLRTMIIHKSPELYLLLMYWAKLSVGLPKKFELQSQEIKATVFTIRWFGINSYNIVQNIMAQTGEHKQVDLSIIKSAFCQSMYEGNLLHIYSPKELQDFFHIGKESSWHPLKTDGSGRWRDFFVHLMAGYGSYWIKEMLLYVERKYVNTEFPEYNPAEKDMWEDYNCPWDFDHIVARNWISGQQGRYREYDKIWLDGMGNIATISYTANRSKNANPDYAEYEKSEEHKESLFFNSGVKELNSNITHELEQSYKFAEISFERLVSIYNCIYDVMCPVVGMDSAELPDSLQMRKQIFESVVQQIKDAKIHFVAEDEQEYEVSRNEDWCRNWMSVGVTKGNFYASVAWTATWNSDGKANNTEIGIRKAPKTFMDHKLRNGLDEREYIKNHYDVKTENDWWYAYKDFSEICTFDKDTDVEEIVNVIVTELNNLIAEIS